MRKFLFFLIGLFIFGEAGADEKTATMLFDGNMNREPLLIVPFNAVNTSDKCSAKELKKVSQTFTERLMTAGINSVSLTADAAYAEKDATTDRKQVYCYRCAVGKAIGLATESWCKKIFKFWSLPTNKEVREHCS